MIAKLECISGRCHIAPDQVGLTRLFPVWTILVLNFVFSLSRNSDCPVYQIFLEIPTPYLLGTLKYYSRTSIIRTSIIRTFFSNKKFLRNTF